MANYYFSGQGSLSVGVRDANGKPMGLVPLGNVPNLEISIEVTKFEHKESETGSRAVDLTVVQEKKGTFTMTLEDMKASNLALGFWGTDSVVAGAAVSDEQVKVYHDKPVPLDFINVEGTTPAPVVGDDATPTTTYVDGTDYTIDLANGTITALSTGSITDLQTVFVDYTHNGSTKMEAFTETSLERYMRFEGLNTIDNTAVVIDIFKAQLDPVTGYAVINEDIAQMTVNGNVLLDSLQTGVSKFFTQRNVGS